MEFLRFGSSIPGEYWGCCACDILQNFKQDPSTKASIQLVSGDGGGSCCKGNELAFAGPTLEDVFRTRIRIGTFGSGDMPNHAFLAILESSQMSPGSVGHKWLKILKEEGFEFIRSFDNSVYTRHRITGSGSPHPNYLFGLFRNISGAKVKNPFRPPTAWTDLPSVVPEAWAALGESVQLEIAKEQTNYGIERWKTNSPTKILAESEITKAGAPVIMAGLRTEFPPQPKAKREEKMKTRKEGKLNYQPSAGTQHLYHG